MRSSRRYPLLKLRKRHGPSSKQPMKEPKIVRNVFRYLLKRFHAKITVIEESKDIDKIPLIELVGNLQTYELGLIRIGKSSKGKSMALKAKSSDTKESSDNEDYKMKSYIRHSSKSLWRMPTQKDLTMTKSNLVLHSSRAKTKGRMMLGMAVSTLFPPDQSVLVVKVLVTWNKSALRISRPLGRARHLLLFWMTPSLRMIQTIRMMES